MSKKKACVKCKIIVEGSECPLCKNAQFSTNWKGRLYIIDSNKSMIAEKIGIKVKGDYVIKV